MAGYRTTRADDERHLEWLHLRCAGTSSEAIARHFGVSPSAVRTVTNRVLAHDLEYAGPHVRSAYWPADLRQSRTLDRTGADQ